jgi:hypothetical protein
MGLVTACSFLESCGVHGQGLWKSVCDCRFAKSFGKNCKSSGLDLLPRMHSMRGKKSIVCVCVCVCLWVVSVCGCCKICLLGHRRKGHSAMSTEMIFSVLSNCKEVLMGYYWYEGWQGLVQRWKDGIYHQACALVEVLHLMNCSTTTTTTTTTH